MPLRVRVSTMDGDLAVQRVGSRSVGVEERSLRRAQAQHVTAQYFRSPRWHCAAGGTTKHRSAGACQFRDEALPVDCLALPILEAP